MESTKNSAKESGIKDVKTSKYASRYLLVGIAIAIFNFGFYSILANLIINNNDYLWLSTFISSVATTIVAYILHSKITWKERHVTKASIIRFFIWNALLAIVISPTLTQLFSLLTPLYEFAYNTTNSLHLSLSYEFVLTTGAFVLTFIVIMILNFLFYDKFVFPKPKASKPYSSCNAFPNIKVSVVIPVYNTAKYLPICLDSVLAQTHHNLEVICINDGSTDKSPAILQKYANKDSRIKTVNQKNQGLSAARNTGLKNTTGDYITFVDSDDEIKSEMIESLLKAMKDSKANIAVCSFEESFPNGEFKSFNKNYPETTYNTENALKAMLKEVGFNVTATMKLFSKNTLKGLEFPIGKLHEDVGFTYKAILNAQKLIFLPQDYYIYHHHDSSIISKFSDQKFDLITLTDQMCDDIEKKNPDLKDTTNERRMRARFSILRQIPTTHPQVKSLLNYLKTHQDFITKNPEATKTDKIALKLALANVKLFQLAYKLFK